MTRITGQSLTEAQEKFLIPRLEGMADSVLALECDNAELRRALRPSCCAKVTATLKNITLIAAGVFLKVAYDYLSATATDGPRFSRYDDKAPTRLFS